ncbi:MAG: hypothetical protein EBQ96_04865 [Proteobacteria bacterium]|nr:hypothetical protein [Pseudomonadota bacterium]
MATPIQAVITAIEDRTETVRILTLMPVTPFLFKAGQYARLGMEGFEPRSFSMASRPEKDGRITFHIRNTGGGLSAALGTAKTGTRLTLEGPFGDMDIAHAQNRPVLMVAGGTGIAPMLAMAQEILRQGLTEEGVKLVFGARTQSDVYCRPELDALLSSGEFTLTEAIGDVTPPQALATENTSLNQHVAYLCGPGPMVSSVRDVLLTRGIKASNIFSDDWSKESA